MKTIGSLRISQKSFDNMEAAIKKFNSDSAFKINQAMFRRMGIELFSQLILEGKDIPKINLWLLATRCNDFFKY